MFKTLLASVAASLLLAAPSQAGSNLQWRKTTCQVQQNGEILAKVPCNAGFAYDTAVRAIKWHYNGETQYDEIGRPGVSFGGLNSRECLGVHYQDGVELLICTVPTPEQLGVRGD